MTAILDALLSSLPDGDVISVLIGLNWTTVIVDVAGEQRCGLASTVRGDHVHGTPDVPQAGRLTEIPARALAALARDDNLTLASVGVAALNALVPPQPDAWTDGNADDVIAQYGAGKSVALIGHFPFIDRLRERVGRLTVLEQAPSPGELPASAAPDVLPQAGVVAITAMTLVNHTLEPLLALCQPAARVLLLGPSTPLSPVLFAHGIDLLSGAVVTDAAAVQRAVAQGATFRQVRRAGVRLVTMRGPV